jgi:prepilin-type N-terminal cleavage/methylation domain-containing protein
MKIFAHHDMLKSNKGITLIELLIVAVIVGILAAIAIPMYNNQMQRARRADAKTALEQLRASQEMRRAERGSYSVDVSQVELRTTWGGPPSPSGDYTITMVATSTTFTGTATPNTGRQASDGWLAINQDGVKTSQYPNKDPWKK